MKLKFNGGAEIINYCKDDAEKWAECFIQYYEKGLVPIEKDTMRAWFANAIETAWDSREHPSNAVFKIVESLDRQIDGGVR
ncbi:MAG: hypothetical protein FWH12_02230 [Treponema sp.]|nr:hypothetical protein [Treponema sp.]